MGDQVYLYDGEVLRLKLTCEERSDGMFIATLWEPDMGLEDDREVDEFETYSAARAKMYENGLNRALQYSNLKMFGTLRESKVLCQKCGGHRTHAIACPNHKRFSRI